MVVCSRHFSRADFILPDFPARKRCLKKNAIPSQNLPVSSCKMLVGSKDKKRKIQAYILNKEGAVGITPCQDKYEICFESVDVAEGQFTTQEHELHSENVDTLLIKEEVSTEQSNEMFYENMTASSIKKEHPFTQELRGCSENADTGEEKCGMHFSIVDVSSIKKEPIDEVNVTRDSFAIGENETVNPLSIKQEQDMEQEECDAYFANNTQMKEGEVGNIIATEQSSRGINETFFENDNIIHIKEEEPEIQENNSYIPINENHFTTQGIKMCSMNLDLMSVKEEQLADESFAVVKVKEEEITFPEQEESETDEVFSMNGLTVAGQSPTTEQQNTSRDVHIFQPDGTDHSANTLHKCETCGKTFMKRKYLLAHVRIHTDERCHKCKVCGKAFRLRYALKRHFLTHKKCQVCHKTFRSLKIHALTHLENQSQECKICNKTFASLRALQTHVRTHTNQIQECKLCGKTLTTLGSLKTHVRVHTGERPYECKICSKNFIRSNRLKEHVRIHTGEQPYQCKTCWKTFKFANTLRLHVRLHANERTFKCKVCDKDFQLLGDLKKHYITHKKNNTYNCILCNERFTDLRRFKKHILVHTREQLY
ncbi:zinc finger protein 426-like isoform X2 [Zootermopsis nevadensis]|nr:zinc finger protein 426-like isoform X2 [Zootermopsis nevadensis]